MIVNLAGFNVDTENIKNIKEYTDNPTKESLDIIKNLNWTPETISASYARISRDERPIDTLRKEARVEIDKSRRSNAAIIFEMGHASIAEHAVFNLDIIDVSRLLSENIEKSRLASFTEKSQRYVKIGTDYYTPVAFMEDKDFEAQYAELISNLFDAYNYLHERLVPYFEAKYPDIKKGDKGYRDIVNLAKEDARYILPLSCFTQLGMTVNARSLEKLLKKLYTINTCESTTLATKIENVVQGYAPSLIKYTKPSVYDTQTYQTISSFVNYSDETVEDYDVELISYDADLLYKIVASFIVRETDVDYRQALNSAKNMTDENLSQIINESFKFLTVHDVLLREFEMSNFEFAIQLSASAFAQLKRHRIATIIDGEYSPRLDNIVPQSIVDINETEYFFDRIDEVNALYYEAKGRYGKLADYMLTNSHKKNIILKCNLRELTHIIRLRSDAHAQWEIRAISDLIAECVKGKIPLLSQILLGKDKFSTGV